MTVSIFFEQFLYNLSKKDDKFIYIKLKEKSLKKGIETALISLLCFCGNALADSMNLNLVLGSSLTKLSNNKYISPAPGLINLYSTNEHRQLRPFYGLGGEYWFDYSQAQSISYGLGLSLYNVNLGYIRGVETPGINILPPPQDTLNYKIQAKSSVVLLEPKLIYKTTRLQPYILGGLGASRNTLRNFKERTVAGSFATPSSSPYTNHSHTNFAYEAGVGLQYVYDEYENNQALVFRIEYRYFNLGKSRLGPGLAQTTNERINVNTTSNSVNLGITYRFR